MRKDAGATRREFLIRLAKTAAFVPPAMATVDVRSLFAQGKGGSTTSSSTSSSSSTSGGSKGGNSTGGTTVGSISPTAQQIESVEFSTFDASQPTGAGPWDTRSPTQPPPWARPPPDGS